MRLAAIVVTLCLAIRAEANAVVAIHTDRDLRPVIEQLERGRLTVKRVKVRQVHIYGLGPRTLLIWDCGEKEIYQYTPPLSQSDVRAWRERLVGRASQETFPILFGD